MRAARRLVFFLLLATALPTAPAVAQVVAQDLVPAAQGLAPAMEAEIDAIFAPWTKPGSPGVAVALVHNGVTVYQKSFGLANVELGVGITPQSVFYLGSVGKQFTAMAVALLEADGKLSVEDDVR
jgi:CubicO group peptidase (beta-lactamase class C family)